MTRERFDEVSLNFIPSWYAWAADEGKLAAMLVEAKNLAETDLMDVAFYHKNDGIIFDNIDGSDKRLMDEYLSHYQHISPRIDWLKQSSNEGVFDDRLIDRFIAEEKIRRDNENYGEEFNSWVTTMGGRYTLTTWTHINDDVVGYLGMARSLERGGHATPTEIRRYQSLVPHIRNGLEFAFKLNQMNARNLTLGLSNSDPGYAAIYLSENGTVDELNPRAKKMLERQPGLLRGKSITPRSGTAWSKIFSSAEAYCKGKHKEPWGNIELSIERDGVDARAYLLPADTSGLKANSLAMAVAPKAAIYIFPKEIEETDALLERLSTVLGLARQQARTAIHLANGVRHKQIASKMNIEMPTVQSHRILVEKKLGTKNKSEITRIILEVQNLFTD